MLDVKTSGGDPFVSHNSFLEETEIYDKVVQATVTVSLRQHGIDTDGRGVRASKIFVRQTVTGLSLRRIVPRARLGTYTTDELWDLSAMALLARALMEGFLGLHYFGTERVSADEAELRFLLAQLHRNVEWYEIRRGLESCPDLSEFQDGIRRQRQRLVEHSYAGRLTNAQRSRVGRNEMYKTKAEFEEELQVCKNLRSHYRLLSNLAHTAPLSIERIDDDKGRGTGSDADVGYALMCRMLGRRYLAASTVAFFDMFADQLQHGCGAPVEGMRDLVLAGFD